MLRRLAVFPATLRTRGCRSARRRRGSARCARLARREVARAGRAPARRLTPVSPARDGARSTPDEHLAAAGESDRLHERAPRPRRQLARSAAARTALARRSRSPRRGARRHPRCPAVVEPTAPTWSLSPSWRAVWTGPAAPTGTTGRRWTQAALASARGRFRSSCTPGFSSRGSCTTSSAASLVLSAVAERALAAADRAGDVGIAAIADLRTAGSTGHPRSAGLTTRRSRWRRHSSWTRAVKRSLGAPTPWRMYCGLVAGLDLHGSRIALPPPWTTGPSRTFAQRSTRLGASRATRACKAALREYLGLCRAPGQRCERRPSIVDRAGRRPVVVSPMLGESQHTVRARAWRSSGGGAGGVGGRPRGPARRVDRGRRRRRAGDRSP